MALDRDIRSRGPANLFEFAYACRLYGEISGYDASLIELRKLGSLDYQIPAHRDALFKWLNAWGCRQFRKAEHGTTATHSLVSWAERWMAQLPSAQTNLTDLSEEKLRLCSAAYADLRNRLASHRSPGHGPRVRVTYGPTGAAKTLHAFRPLLFPPWDEPIRAKLALSPSGSDFGNYLRGTSQLLLDLADRAGVPIQALPELVHRPQSSPPKLIDEYFWVILTKECEPPSVAEIAEWMRWMDA